MKKLFLLAIALMLIAGCVSFPEEEPQKPEEILLPAEPKLEAAPEPAPVQNATEPNPLAPLPKQNTSNIAPRPKAITVNAANTTAPPKPVQKGWTTESLSIEEGETKYVYIKQ